MPAARALRYPSVAFMPDGLRQAAEKQLQKAANAPTVEKKPRRPSRDEEHNEQVVFFNRIKTLAMNDSRYAVAADRTYAIPNGGGRSKRQAGRLKAEGVRAGVSDTFTSFPAGEYHGLYIEMKKLDGYASREQAAWISDSLRLGYMAACCRGANEAMKVWKAYVEASF